MSYNSTYSFARVLRKVNKYILVGCLSLPSIALAQGDSSGSITLYPNNTTINPGLNSNVVSRNDEIVTVGIPFADCTLYDSNKFRLFSDTNTEIKVHVEVLTEWPANRQPCGMSSIRALKVQFEFDATSAAPAVYKWDLSGPRSNADYGSGFDINSYEVVHDNPIKGSLKEPRVFAINDPAYLVQSGLMPPTATYTPGDYDDNYYPMMWNKFANNFNFTTSTAANWLFDRASALYRQAMRTGNVEYYREAYVSHEFYIDKIEVTGTNTIATDYCIGGFDFDGKANEYADGGSGCDSKYFYTQNVRLHLSLTGDDSWVPSDNGTPSSSGVIDTRDKAWNTIADLLFTGSARCPGQAPWYCEDPAVPAPGFSDAYDQINDLYTERKPGLGLQTILSACQLTLDATTCGRVDTIVDAMYNHQINNPDGRGDLGYLAHSWHRHEGWYFPWLGDLVADYTNATTVVIGNSIANSPGLLVAGNLIRFQNTTLIVLAQDPVKNADGSWTLKLVTPLTGKAGERLLASYKDSSTQHTSNELLDTPVDRVFSPWMQSIIADGLWEYYFWTENATQKAKVEALLRGFARAVAAYGIGGERLNSSTKTLVENAFDVSIFDSNILAVGCGLTQSPFTRYVANDLMGTHPDINEAYMKYMLSESDYSDTHTPEALFQLSLGILFETDVDKKAAMEALAADMQEWFAKYSCTAGAIGYPARAINWQTKADPFGTYAFVSKLDLTNTPDIEEPSSPPEGAINYSGSVFQENVVNNGGTDTVITVELTGDTFQNDGNFNDDEVIVAGVPAGLTGSMTRVDNNTVTFKLSGNQTPHAATNSVAGISLEFTDHAFESLPAEAVRNSIKSNFSVNFRNSILSYNSDTFLESSSNEGASSTFLTVSLAGGESFVVKDAPMNSSHFATSNVPANMTVKVVGTSSTTARVELAGNASNHVTDVTNLTISFLDAAFSGRSAASVVNATKSDIRVDFINLPDVDEEDAPVESDAPVHNGKPDKKPKTRPVRKGSLFKNLGTLTDVDNQGIIEGGMLEGEVNNENGILSDVTLAPASQISGGLIQGSLMGTGSVSNTILDVDALDSGISIGPVTQVTSKTVSNIKGLNLTDAILDESGTPNIDFPFLSDSELGELSLAELTEQALNGYYNNAGSVTGFSIGGSIVLTNEELADSVIPVQPSLVMTTDQPDGVVLTSDGNLEINSRGISMTFTPAPLDGSSISSNISPIRDGLVSIQVGEVTLLQRFGWMASRPRNIESNRRALSATSEATIELVGSGHDPASQKVIIHYPDNTTQTMISYLDNLTAFANIVAQSEYEASVVIDPLTGIMRFYDPEKNLIFTAIPDVVSSLPERGITEAVLENAGDLNGDGYQEYYFKTPVRTQLIYGLAP